MTAAHALAEIVSVRYGVIVECRCGWVEHVKPGQYRGDDFNARKGARIAIKQHKAQEAQS